MVGSNFSSTLIACYATGSVTVTGDGSGSIYVGGVTGDNFASTLTACYHAAGTVSGPDGATGGVTGRNFKDSMLDGGIITARSAGWAFDLGLALLSALRGPEAAEKVRQAILYRV